MKVNLRSFRSSNSFGLALFQPGQLGRWQSYVVLAIRPRQRCVLMRLPHHLVGLSWWPPRFWNAAALQAERDKATAT